MFCKFFWAWCFDFFFGWFCFLQEGFSFFRFFVWRGLFFLIKVFFDEKNGYVFVFFKGVWFGSMSTESCLLLSKSFIFPKRVVVFSKGWYFVPEDFLLHRVDFFTNGFEFFFFHMGFEFFHFSTRFVFVFKGVCFFHRFCLFLYQMCFLQKGLFFYPKRLFFLRGFVSSSARAFFSKAVVFFFSKGLIFFF